MNLVLLFNLANECYGLEVDHIQEIVERPPSYFIPRAPKFFSGAINFHGRILPVLDLGGYLGFPENVDPGRVIVLEARLSALAIGVDQVRRIVPCDSEALLPPTHEQQKNFIRATFSWQQEVVGLLDLSRLLLGLEKRV